VTPATTTQSGRPLDEELSGSILDAALRVLGREGYGGFSMAAVAQEAGVHRPAIYRRWPNKADLAVAAIERLRPAPVDRASGDVRADLVAYLVDAGCGPDEVYDLALRLHNDLTAHPDLSEAVQQQISLPRRRLVTGILQRGIDAGQLRPDLDTELAIDMLYGLLYARKNRTPPLTPDEIERYVDLVLGGLR